MFARNVGSGRMGDYPPLRDKYGATWRKKLVGKVGLPGVAWFAVCQDSEGNTFAIFQPDPAAR